MGANRVYTRGERVRAPRRPPRVALQAYIGLGEAEALRDLAERIDEPVAALVRRAIREMLGRERAEEGP